jgi:hypothetical protein
MADESTDREITAEEAAAIAARTLGDPELEDKLKGLTTEQIQLFVAALGQAMRKRRLMLLGYLSALMSIVLGLVFALIMYANHEPGTFIGWVFFVPFGLAAFSVWLFGRLANRIKVTIGDVQIDTKGQPIEKTTSAGD